MLKIIHCITTLDIGGAESMLCKILSNDDKSKFMHMVFSLKGGGKLSARIKAQNIPVHEIGVEKKNFLVLFNIIKMLWHYFKFKPDIIFGWMYHGNTLALLLYFLSLGRIKLIWSIRQTLYDIKKEKPLTAFLIRIGGLLSNFTSIILYNSFKSFDQHNSIGYSKKKGLTIPNGFDCNEFSPDIKKRLRTREILGLNNDTIVIGIIARYHPMKNHIAFIKVAAMLLKEYSNLAFVMAGRNVDEENKEISILIQNERVSRYFHLLGEFQKPSMLMCGIDILVSSSSWGEGFPNILGEAMACAVPCVATNIGDSSLVVGDAGVVVLPSDLNSLFLGIKSILDLKKNQRRLLGLNARLRIQNNFTIKSIVEKYSRVITQINRMQIF